MAVQLVEVDCTKKFLIEQIKELYLQAFPKEERKPFPLMEKLQKEGKVQIFAIINDRDEDFCGLAITLLNGNYVLLDYFAILPQKRGSGIGSDVFQLLKKQYQDKTFFLEIEETEKMENLSEEEKKLRVRRKNFYLKNGMKDSTLRVCLFGVLMEVLSDGTFLTFEEYYGLYKETIGEKVIRQRILANTEEAVLHSNEKSSFCQTIS